MAPEVIWIQHTAAGIVSNADASAYADEHEMLRGHKDVAIPVFTSRLQKIVDAIPCFSCTLKIAPGESICISTTVSNAVKELCQDNPRWATTEQVLFPGRPLHPFFVFNKTAEHWVSVSKRLHASLTSAGANIQRVSWSHTIYAPMMTNTMLVLVCMVPGSACANLETIFKLHEAIQARTHGLINVRRFTSIPIPNCMSLDGRATIPHDSLCSIRSFFVYDVTQADIDVPFRRMWDHGRNDLISISHPTTDSMMIGAESVDDGSAEIRMSFAAYVSSAVNMLFGDTVHVGHISETRRGLCAGLRCDLTEFTLSRSKYSLLLREFSAQSGTFGVTNRTNKRPLVKVDAMPVARTKMSYKRSRELVSIGMPGACDEGEDEEDITDLRPNSFADRLFEWHPLGDAKLKAMTKSVPRVGESYVLLPTVFSGQSTDGVHIDLCTYDTDAPFPCFLPGCSENHRLSCFYFGWDPDSRCLFVFVDDQTSPCKHGRGFGNSRSRAFLVVVDSTTFDDHYALPGMPNLEGETPFVDAIAETMYWNSPQIQDWLNKKRINDMFIVVPAVKRKYMRVRGLPALVRYDPVASPRTTRFVCSFNNTLKTVRLAELLLQDQDFIDAGIVNVTKNTYSAMGQQFSIYEEQDVLRLKHVLTVRAFAVAKKLYAETKRHDPEAAKQLLTDGPANAQITIKLLIVVPSITLAMQCARTFGCVFYSDITQNTVKEDRIFARLAMRCANRVVSTVHSDNYFGNYVKVDTLVCDEFSVSFRQFNKLMDSQGTTALNAAAFFHHLRTCAHLEVADADLTEIETRTVEKLRMDSDIELVFNAWSSEGTTYNTFLSTSQMYLATLYSASLIAKNSPKMRRFVVFSTSPSQLDDLYDDLTKLFPNLRVGLATGNRSTHSELLRTTRSWLNFDILLFSPVVAAGISFKPPTAWFYDTYMFCGANSSLPRDWMQWAHRVRDVYRVYINVSIMGTGDKPIDLTKVGKVTDLKNGKEGVDDMILDDAAVKFRKHLGDGSEWSNLLMYIVQAYRDRETIIRGNMFGALSQLMLEMNIRVNELLFSEFVETVNPDDVEVMKRDSHILIYLINAHNSTRNKERLSKRIYDILDADVPEDIENCSLEELIGLERGEEVADFTDQLFKILQPTYDKNVVARPNPNVYRKAIIAKLAGINHKELLHLDVLWSCNHTTNVNAMQLLCSSTKDLTSMDISQLIRETNTLAKMKLGASERGAIQNRALDLSDTLGKFKDRVGQAGGAERRLAMFSETVPDVLPLFAKFLAPAVPRTDIGTIAGVANMLDAAFGISEILASTSRQREPSNLTVSRTGMVYSQAQLVMKLILGRVLGCRTPGNLSAVFSKVFLDAQDARRRITVLSRYTPTLARIALLSPKKNHRDFLSSFFSIYGVSGLKICHREFAVARFPTNGSFTHRSPQRTDNAEAIGYLSESLDIDNHDILRTCSCIHCEGVIFPSQRLPNTIWTTPTANVPLSWPLIYFEPVPEENLHIGSTMESLEQTARDMLEAAVLHEEADRMAIHDLEVHATGRPRKQRRKRDAAGVLRAPPTAEEKLAQIRAMSRSAVLSSAENMLYGKGHKLAVSEMRAMLRLNKSMEFCRFKPDKEYIDLVCKNSRNEVVLVREFTGPYAFHTLQASLMQYLTLDECLDTYDTCMAETYDTDDTFKGVVDNFNATFTGPDTADAVLEHAKVYHGTEDPHIVTRSPCQPSRISYTSVQPEFASNDATTFVDETGMVGVGTLWFSMGIWGGIHFYNERADGTTANNHSYVQVLGNVFKLVMRAGSITGLFQLSPLHAYGDFSKTVRKVAALTHFRYRHFRRVLPFAVFTDMGPILSSTLGLDALPSASGLQECMFDCSPSHSAEDDDEDDY